MPIFKTIEAKRELFVEYLFDGEPGYGFWDTDPKTAHKHIKQEFMFHKYKIKVRVNGFIFGGTPSIAVLQDILDGKFSLNV